MNDRPRLHSVQSMALSSMPVEFIGPAAYQAACVDAFVASQMARGFSQLTIDNGTGVLERFLAIAGKPAWELEPEDIDLVMAALIDRGVGTVTRRGYVGTFKAFFAFLEARHGPEIESRFGARLSNPLDIFHAGRHVGSDSPATRPPPTPARMEEVLHLPAPADGRGPQMDTGRTGLCLNADALSRRIALCGSGKSGDPRPAF